MRNIINSWKYENNKSKFICFKPCTKVIGKNVTIDITDRFIFNKQWHKKTDHRNTIPGMLNLCDDSTLIANDFRIYAGSKITVNKGATLKLGKGYMNYNSSIECFNHIEIGNNAFAVTDTGLPTSRPYGKEDMSSPESLSHFHQSLVRSSITAE